MNFLLKTINETGGESDGRSYEPSGIPLSEGLCFTLQVTARNTTNRIHLFHEINSQGKKSCNPSPAQRSDVTKTVVSPQVTLTAPGAFAARQWKGCSAVEVERFSNNVHLLTFTSLRPIAQNLFAPLFRCASSNGLHCRPPNIQKASAGLMLRCCRECRVLMSSRYSRTSRFLM